MKKIAILTSGGDSPGMNAAIRAAVRTALYMDMEVYGVRRGYEGLMEGDMYTMDMSSVSDILHKGGTILRTARSENFRTPEGRKKALMMLENYGIEGLIVIGGDGSMTGGLALSKEGNVTVMGLPGTIDNDLAYTDYTIGFDTSINTVLTSISNIRDTSSSHERTTIIEVMGRSCGDIALYTGLTGGAESILIPEIGLDINAICRKMLHGKHRGKLHNIIMKAEGIEFSTEELAKTLYERTGMETKIVVLGYIQRGGSPTARDRMLASRTAYKAVELLKEGCTVSSAIGVQGDNVIYYPIEEALKMKREYDREMMAIADILSM